MLDIFVKHDMLASTAPSAAGRYLAFLEHLNKAKVIILDDFGLRAYTHEEATALVDVLEERYRKGVVIVTSQVDDKGWKKLFEDTAVANAILDRLTHPSQKLVLRGSTSTDVVFEGKGVVRFMDVTQHNGNTFNTAFIAKGGTGLAYGDDTPCPICDKGLETHRIHEVSETQAMAGAVLLGLLEKFKAQRPIIAEHQRLKEARNRIEDEYKPKVDAIERLREPLNKRRGELIASIATDATAKAKLTEVQKQLAPLDAQSKALRTEREAKKQEVLVKMKAEHAKLTGSNVLRDDDASGTYTLGYMVGALVCKCPSNPKKLAACSGETTPGFRAVVGEVGFTLVQAFEQTPRQVAAVKAMKRKTWDCAGPKLIQKGGAEGHKIKSLSEQYFSPWGSVSVEVTYSRDGTRTTRTFSSGESVPSCATCQELVPEMLCDNSKPCA